MGKVTQQQSQCWNILLSVSQGRLPATQSKQRDPVNQRGPSAPVISGCSWPVFQHTWFQASYWGTHLLFCSSAKIFYYLHFRRVEKLFWPTSWQNLLTSLNTTQPKEWGEPWWICARESPFITPCYFGSWSHSKSMFPKYRCCCFFFFFFRILEFENPHVTSNNKGTGCEFELWDCGGDPKYVSFKRVCFIKWFKNQLLAQYLGLAHFLAYIRGLVSWLVTCIALETLVIGFWYSEKSSINYQY